MAVGNMKQETISKLQMKEKKKRDRGIFRVDS